jgi:hypothetical protein
MDQGVCESNLQTVKLPAFIDLESCGPSEVLENHRRQSQQSRSWGCVATIDSNGRTIWIADAHRQNGKRFVAHAEEKLTAFLELESAISACGEVCLTSGRDFSGTIPDMKKISENAQSRKMLFG